MATIFGIETGLSIPSLSGSSNIIGTLTWIAAIVMVTILCGIGFWVWYNNRLFNKKIIIWENVGAGHYQQTGQDRARLIKLGDGGEEVLYLKNRKLFRTAYGRKQGKNTYWFAVAQDGYWYNIVLGDLDAKKGMLDIEPVETDLRYMHVALRKNAQERYRKKKFMETYGTLIINGIFLVMMVVAVWLLIDQVGNLIGEATQTVGSVTANNELIIKSLSKVDEICSGGSGISSAL